MQLENEVHTCADCKPPVRWLHVVHLQWQRYIEAAVQRAADSAQ